MVSFAQSAPSTPWTAGGFFLPSPSFPSPAPIPYTWITPDERLNCFEIRPPSEQEPYTEEDALVEQYLNQHCLEGHFEDGRFVQTSTSPVRLMQKENIPPEELERFKQELIQNGLGTEIDWRRVESDLGGMNVNFDNVQRFEQKADYLASRYALLKDRIQTQFTGDGQEAEFRQSQWESVFPKQMRPPYPPMISSALRHMLVKWVHKSSTGNLCEIDSDTGILFLGLRLLKLPFLSSVPTPCSPAPVGTGAPAAPAGPLWACPPSPAWRRPAAQ